MFVKWMPRSGCAGQPGKDGISTKSAKNAKCSSGEAAAAMTTILQLRQNASKCAKLKFATCRWMKGLAGQPCHDISTIRQRTRAKCFCMEAVMEMKTTLKSWRFVKFNARTEG